MALTLCVVAGGALNLYRTAWRPSGQVQVFRGFYPQEDAIDGQTVRWSRAYAKAEVPLYRWRQLRWRVALTSPPAAPPEGASAWLLVNDVRMRRVTVSSGWHTIEFDSDIPATSDVALQIYSTLYGDKERGVGIGRVEVQPVFTTWNVLQHGVVGALIAALAWLVCLIGPEWSAKAAGEGTDDVGAPPLPVTSRVRWRHAIAILLIVWAYLGLWSVLKPPFQAPDEPQHLLRAASVRLQPWATLTGDTLTLDPRFFNPLVYWPPGNIGKLFFTNTNHLSKEDIAVLKAVPWRRTDLPPLAPYRTPLATYPTAYYGSVFGLAEPTTALWHLSPYQNTYAYRAWTIVLAGLLWLAVYLVLRTTPGAERHANALFLFLLINPMLAFVTSSVTPDSVNVPIATLAVLLTYGTVTIGGSIWLTTAALVACGLTKPTFLLILGSLPLPMLLAWRSGAISMRSLVAGALAVARAGVIAYCVFYAWSPPRFFAGAMPKTISLASYTDHYIDRLPVVWRSYWGVLGWLDYQLDDLWYLALFVVVIAVAILARRHRTPDEAHLTRFAAWLGVGYFVLMTIGEYWYLPRMGYNFQGRHLLPASLALGGLVLHGNRYARWTLLGFLALMNVMLIHATIVRYFDDGLTGLWASLPTWQ
jgi:hypothetical protein